MSLTERKLKISSNVHLTLILEMYGHARLIMRSVGEVYITRL